MVHRTVHHMVHRTCAASRGTVTTRHNQMGYCLRPSNSSHYHWPVVPCMSCRRACIMLACRCRVSRSRLSSARLAGWRRGTGRGHHTQRRTRRSHTRCAWFRLCSFVVLLLTVIVCVLLCRLCELGAHALCVRCSCVPGSIRLPLSCSQSSSQRQLHPVSS